MMITNQIVIYCDCSRKVEKTPPCNSNNIQFAIFGPVISNFQREQQETSKKTFETRQQTTAF